MQYTTLNGFQLSPQQKRLWLLQQESSAYLTQCAICLQGELNVELLKAALQQIIKRNEILRTTFHRFPGVKNPVMIVAETASAVWHEVDLNDETTQEKTAKVEEIFHEVKHQELSFEKSSLLGLTLVKLSKNTHILQIYLPALCADAGTIKNLFAELSNLYQNGLKENSKNADFLQYLQFSEWQNQLLEDEEAKTAKEYWSQQELSSLATLKLPFEQNSLKPSKFTPDCFKLAITPDVSVKIEELAAKYKTTVAIVLLACWKTLIWKLVGQSEIIIGTASEQREYEELQDILGLCSTWLPIRCHLTPDLPFTEVLELTEKAISNAKEWQDYFTSESINNDSPLTFPIGFEFEQLPTKYIADNVSFSFDKYYSCIETFKIKLTCTHQDECLNIELFYDVNYFSANAIQCLAEQFQTLLTSVIENPDIVIVDLEIISQSERQQLLVNFNKTQKNYPKQKCIHELFEEQAEKFPEKIAVVVDSDSLTYAQLNARANQLARHLHSFGVGAESIVGLYVERSVEMVIGLLGILKAGAAYLPIDPQLPQQRIRDLLCNAQPSVIISTQQLSQQLDIATQTLICLDSIEDEIGEYSDTNLANKATANNLVYVIYTSGSTGKPKGVAVEHQQLVNYVYSISERLELESGWSFASVSSIAADLGNTAIFPSLCTGGCLHLISKQRATDAEAFAEYCQRSAIDCLKIVPTHLSALLTTTNAKSILPRKRLILGGESAPGTLIQKLQQLQPQCRIFNHYGPTETTVGVLTYEIVANTMTATQSVAVGSPIANTVVYLLDCQYNPVPIGVTGELYIGGAGLTRGYLHAGELTAEKFIPNPFSNSPGDRLYKTGDQARYLPNGDLEYIGRVDHQVKLRGFRIELAEIEAVLAQHPQVAQTVVHLTHIASDELRIIAYVVQKQQSPTTDIIEQLREYVQHRLPDYMVPASFVMLDALPLTDNGKINRQALPTPEMTSVVQHNRYQAPRTPIEEILAQIWADVLRVELVGVYDNFFTLGGHSLLATQLISRVKGTFTVDIPLSSFFENPTISGLAECIDTARRLGLSVATPRVSPMARDEKISLSFAQARLWFLDQLAPGNPFYNMPCAIHLRGLLNVEALEYSFNEMIRRHETLRTTFPIVEGQPVQLIAASLNIKLPVLNLQPLSETERESEVQRLLIEEARQPFSLAQGPLLQAKLLKLGETEHILLLTMHHIISDGWSTSIFVREIGAVYTAKCKQLPLRLEDLPVQYADFAIWQRHWLQGEVLEAHLAYWKQQLNGIQTLAKLPTDKPRPLSQTFQGSVESFVLPGNLSESLKALSHQQGVTLFMTLLATFQILLHYYTAQDDIVVGTDVANRNQPEIEGLIGFFVNQLVLRTNLSGNPTFNELLARVREVALGAYAHQDLPFNLLVEALKPERDLSRMPLFQVKFVLQNTPVSALELPDLTLKLLEIDKSTAKFDWLLNMSETEEGLSGSLQYNTDLFEAATITRILQHFETLLVNVVAQPNIRLKAIEEILAEADKQQRIIKEKELETIAIGKLKKRERKLMAN